jgi:hypothetical protein
MSDARSIQDNSSEVKVNIAMPNAANTVNSNTIDLGSNSAYPVQESFVVKITGATATGANSKNVNCVLQHSNEAAANFTNITGMGAPILVLAGNAANVIGGSVTVSLPPSTKRYVRVSATGEANGGNAADGNLTLQLLF